MTDLQNLIIKLKNIVIEHRKKEFFTCDKDCLCFAVDEWIDEINDKIIEGVNK